MKLSEELGFEYKVFQKVMSELKELKKMTKQSIVTYLDNEGIEEDDAEQVKTKVSRYNRTFYTKSKIKEAFSDVMAEDEIEACLDSIEPTEIENVYVTVKDTALEAQVADKVNKVTNKIEQAGKVE